MEFTFVDVGKSGRHSHGDIVEYTQFYHKLINGKQHFYNNKFYKKIFVGQLHLPDNDETEKNLYFVFLGDEAFALYANFLKPYPQRDLSYERRICNYRLSRGARSVSESAFGLRAARFRILHNYRY